MKSKIFLFLGLSITCFVQTLANQISLPTQCQKLLDRQYKGWRIASVPDEIVSWFKESRQIYQPNLIKGDWNGDRRTDYAVMIQKAKYRPDETGVFLAVFLKKRTGYSLYKLGANDYIVMLKKGSKDYDYETDRTFTYKNDAIFTGIFEKAGSTYVWRKGKFISIATSD